MATLTLDLRFVADREMGRWAPVVALTSTTVGFCSSLFRLTSPSSRWRPRAHLALVCLNLLLSSFLNSHIFLWSLSEFCSMERGAVWRGADSTGALRYAERPLTFSPGPGVSTVLTFSRLRADESTPVFRQKKQHKLILKISVGYFFPWVCNHLKLRTVVFFITSKWASYIRGSGSSRDHTLHINVNLYSRCAIKMHHCSF